MPKFLQQEAALSILRAADLISQESASVMKPFDLTVSQFNILRILRGSPDGLPCGQIGERMINRDPDITRLLDRMEAHKLIERQRGEQDRRVVTARISAEGLKLLERVDPVVHACHLDQFEDFSHGQLQQIIDLMGNFLKSRGYAAALARNRLSGASNKSTSS
jgi:DNA-binding MarR family transcriptional regulator